MPGNTKSSANLYLKLILKEIKTGYIKFLVYKARMDLSKYAVSGNEAEMVNSLLDRILHTQNLLKDLYILTNIPELKNLGKYLVYILKKLEDGVISFDNVAQNFKADKEYIENEIISMLSNPQLRKIAEAVPEEETEEDAPVREREAEAHVEHETARISEEPEEKEEEDFKKNYLELIYSESGNDDSAFEIPKIENEKQSADSDTFAGDAAFEMPEETESSVAAKGEIKDSGNSDIEGNETAAETMQDAEVIQEEAESDTDQETEISSDETEAMQEETMQLQENRISLSPEIQEELEYYIEEEELEDEPEEAVIDEPPTNALFLKYEDDVMKQNRILDEGFEKMISYGNSKTYDGAERSDTIAGIISVSRELELYSQKMSLEIISNIYNTITLSFEKISEGKYDLSESTLRLFSRGLHLIGSLIKGDDYFGYKDILRSIENIRSALLEDRRKKEDYERRMIETKKAASEMKESFADEEQKEKFFRLRDLIKDTELKLKQIDRITGEYKIYEALRSISIPLNNFKEIVKIARELNLEKMVKLSEGSYVFIKFLQNYRINPVSDETKEIFSYIIFNLKSLALGKEAEDIDVFISYLNDPVKIFSNSKSNKQ